MSDETVTRRLAAIMAIDVVGYSRLMSVDEADTHKRVSGYIEGTVKPAIATHKGRVVKMTGDGLLAEFPSAVEGVQAAVDIQHAMSGQEPDIAEDRKVTFRIGVNLGDIIIEADDIYGDGVNVAARIEALADPGGVFISRAVADQITGKLSVNLEDLGGHAVKNIPQPVHVFRVLFDGAKPSGNGTAPEADSQTAPRGNLLQARTGMALAAVAIGVIAAAVWLAPWKTPPQQTQAVAPSAAITTTKPIIAVLPFNNFSDDKDQEYFSDGLTEDLITDVSKISGLSVIARNSTFSYKGQTPDVREVGTALGATHVIEGSVRKAGNTVRITVQLIDVSDGTHVWADRYDRKLKDIFAIQDEVIGQIIQTLSLKLTPEEERRIARHGTDSLEAYELYMRGLQQESYFTKDGHIEAQRYYEQALEIDPNYAEAMAHLAQIHTMNGQFGWVDDIVAADARALELAEESIQLGPDVPFARWALSRILARDSIAQHDRAIAEAKKAIELDPSYADAYAYLGQLYILTGQAERTPQMVKFAMQINPNFPYWYYYSLGFAHFFMDDPETAVKNISKAVEANPTVIFYRTSLAASLVAAGQIEDAEWQIDELFGMGFDKSLDEVIDESPIQHPAYLKKLREALAKAGLE